MALEKIKMTGGEALVKTLLAGGVDRAFCVPGESYMAALDALLDAPQIDLVQARHEGGAGLMAIADARLTGRPGICFVSRGPGAGNATMSVHVAQQDAVPYILFIGQVERQNLGRGAFQEVDYVKTFSDMAKWVIEVHDPSRLSEYVARAFQVATSGTPGPVVISLPEDMLEEEVETEIVTPRLATRPTPASTELEAISEMIAMAERPILLAGGDCATPEARRELLAFSESWNVPVASTNKRQHCFPNIHQNWIGHIGYLVSPKLRAQLDRADLIVALGSRLGDVSTQRFTYPAAPNPRQPLVHVYPDASVIGKNHQPKIGVVAHAADLLTRLNRSPRSRDRSEWFEALRAVRDELEGYEVTKQEDGIDFGAVALAVDSQMADDAIITLDAGNFVSWIHGLVHVGPSNETIGAVGGAMGLAVPAAVAASIRYPSRQVLAFVGDGGFMMTGYELATAVMRGAQPKIFVSNNNSYGVIRTHQETAYPGRVIGTDLVNPDFAALADSFGAKGIVIASDDDVSAKVAEALAAKGPVVVDVHTSLQKLNMYKSLSDLADGP